MSVPIPDRAGNTFAGAKSSVEEAAFVDDDGKDAAGCCIPVSAAGEQATGEPIDRSKPEVGMPATNEVPAQESGERSGIGVTYEAWSSSVDTASETPDLTAREKSLSAEGAQSNSTASPARTEVPNGTTETNTDPVIIFVNGNESPAELHGLRENARIWDGPNVIFKRKPPKPNGVPWDTTKLELPYTVTPLPKPNSILLSLLHNLMHEVEPWPNQVGVNHPSSILVLSTAGSLGYALAHHTRDLTMVHPDPIFVKSLKDEPYGCRGTCRRMLEEDPHRYHSQVEYECYSSVIYRNAPLDQTGLPPASFDVIIIEQGHRSNMIDIIAEAGRLARPNGIVALASYMPLKVIPKKDNPVDVASAMHINTLVKSYFDNEFRRYMNANERHLFQGFRKLTLPPRYFNFPDFRERIDADIIFPLNKCLMEANWNGVEFLNHILSWPVLTRVGRRSFIQSAGPRFTHEVSKVWGKRRRQVRANVVVRTAVVRR